MQRETLGHLKEHFATLVELAAPQREVYLRQLDDDNLRQALRDLLRADDGMARMTARPAVPRHGPAAPVTELASGVIGGFAVRHVLGRGGMGTVYLAERAVPGGVQRIALKCLHPIGAAEEFERRFQSEISVLAQLSHPHIARLIDAGQEADGRCWIAMEFIEGVPLGQYCDERNLGIPARLALFDTLCDAVSAAHRSLVVHRDIKSTNVLVREDGELFLIDFGIARALGASADVTQQDQRFLSPLNAPPEQVRGDPTTTSCDVYGLGVLLYELLCGAPPINPDTSSGEAMRDAVLHQVPLLASARLRQLLHSDAARVREIAQHRSCIDAARLIRLVQGDLEQVCAVALRKQPHERYASIDQLRDDLDRAASGRPILARGNDRVYRTGRWMRRHAIALSFSAAAAIALVAGVTALWLQARSLEQERDHARAQTHLAQQQEQRAEFLGAFLLDAFEQADPSRTMGATLTAKQILDAGVRQLRDAQDTDPQSRIGIAITLADVEYRLGLNADGDELVDYSHERLAELANPAPRLLAKQHYVEGVRASNRAEFAQARQHAESGLTLLGKVDDAAGERLWLALKCQRADALVKLGDRAGSIAMFRELIASLGALHWAQRIDVWDLRMKLAHSLDLTADTRPEARTLLNQVLQEQADAHADGTASNALALRSLASVELRSANAHASLLNAEKSLAIYRKIYGEQHAMVARGLNSLALAEAQDGHPELAVEHSEQALQILQRTGPPDLLYVGILYNIGVHYNGPLHDLAKAERYFRAAITGFRRQPAQRARHVHSRSGAGRCTDATAALSRGRTAAGAQLALLGENRRDAREPVPISGRHRHRAARAGTRQGSP